MPPGPSLVARRLRRQTRRLHQRLEAATGDLPAKALFERARGGFYDGTAQEEINWALVMAAKRLIGFCVITEYQQASALS